MPTTWRDVRALLDSPKYAPFLDCWAEISCTPADRDPEDFFRYFGVFEEFVPHGNDTLVATFLGNPNQDITDHNVEPAPANWYWEHGTNRPTNWDEGEGCGSLLVNVAGVSLPLGYLADNFTGDGVALYRLTSSYLPSLVTFAIDTSGRAPVEWWPLAKSAAEKRIREAIQALL